MAQRRPSGTTPMDWPCRRSGLRFPAMPPPPSRPRRRGRCPWPHPSSAQTWAEPMAAPSWPSPWPCSRGRPSPMSAQGWAAEPAATQSGADDQPDMPAELRPPSIPTTASTRCSATVAVATARVATGAAAAATAEIEASRGDGRGRGRGRGRGDGPYRGPRRGGRVLGPHLTTAAVSMEGDTRPRHQAHHHQPSPPCLLAPPIPPAQQPRLPANEGLDEEPGSPRQGSSCPQTRNSSLLTTPQQQRFPTSTTNATIEGLLAERPSAAWLCQSGLHVRVCEH